MKTLTKFVSTAALVGSICVASSATASSHREAPAIAEDPMADNTDVYVFISPQNPDNLVVVANYVPLLLPSSGPNFYKFADSVRYEIRFDNDGDAKPDITFRWTFQDHYRSEETFLYATGPAAGGSMWFSHGRADALRLFSEPWRMITALTLHADGQHVIGNAISGSIFGTMVARRIGPGGALFAILLSGIIGNTLNALHHLPDGHYSIGASTAVFGAVGMLVNFAVTTVVSLVTPPPPERVAVPPELGREVG